MTISEDFTQYHAAAETLANAFSSNPFYSITLEDKSLLFNFLGFPEQEFIAKPKPFQLFDLQKSLLRHGFKYHPDRYQEPEDKEKAEQLFKSYGRCVEVLTELVNRNEIPSSVSSKQNKHETSLGKECDALYKKLKNDGPNDALMAEFQSLRAKYSAEQWMQLEHSDLETLLGNVLGLPAKSVAFAADQYSRSKIVSSFGIKKNENPGVILEELEILYNAYTCIGLTDLFFQQFEKKLTIKLDQENPHVAEESPSKELSVGNQRKFNPLSIQNGLKEFLLREFIFTIEAGTIDSLSSEYPIESLIELATVTDPHYLHQQARFFYEKINISLAKGQKKLRYQENKSLLHRLRLLERYNCLRLATHLIDSKLELLILAQKIHDLIDKFMSEEFKSKWYEHINPIDKFMSEEFKSTGHKHINPEKAKDLERLICIIRSELRQTRLDWNKQKILRVIFEDKLLSLYFCSESAATNSASAQNEKLFEPGGFIEVAVILKSLAHESSLRIIYELPSSVSTDPFNIFQNGIRHLDLAELQFLRQLMTEAESLYKSEKNDISIDGLDYSLSHLKELVPHPQWESLMNRLEKDIQKKGGSTATTNMSLTSSGSGALRRITAQTNNPQTSEADSNWKQFTKWLGFH